MRLLHLIYLLITLLLTLPAYAAENHDYDYTQFARLPIQDEGRIKPLDTFARSYLKIIYGRDCLPDKPAIAWLAEVLFTPEQAAAREVFSVPPAIAHVLKLTPRESRRYNFQEMLTAIMGNLRMIAGLYAAPENELTLNQTQLLVIVSAVNVFADLSRSFSMVAPLTTVDDARLAKALGIEPQTKLNYLELLKKRDLLLNMSTNSEATQLLRLLEEVETAQNTRMLAVMPPLWGNSEGRWLSFWAIGMSGSGSPESVRMLNLWNQLRQAYNSGKKDTWQSASNILSAAMQEVSKPYIAHPKLITEHRFHQFKPLELAAFFYLLAFTAIIAAMLFGKAKYLYTASAVLAVTAVVIHASGLVMRMVIMGRPPVSNLYESIIFVSLAASILGLVLEWRRSHGYGMLLASIAGAVLLYIAGRYEAEGDTLRVLTAVLDTNFWLATHVVAITIGYAATISASVLAHIYLLLRVIGKNRISNSLDVGTTSRLPLPFTGGARGGHLDSFSSKSAGQQKWNFTNLTSLYGHIYGISLAALLFTTLGTILGGIWADQSWGRFWGWDPKENGALLIVLWLIFVIHGRLAGLFREEGVVMGIAAAGITVALAWFGVNLLSVGLHSYGFTRHAGLYLGLYITAEIAFIITCGLLIKYGISDRKMI